MPTFSNKYITEDKCPFCEHEGIDLGSPETDQDYIYIENECPECHAFWTDFYVYRSGEDPCPECGSYDGTFEQVDMDGDTAVITVVCDECGTDYMLFYEYEESEDRR